MRKISAILYSLMFLTSCTYSAMYHLSENDKIWVNMYSKDDVFLFHYGKNTDTLLIDQKNIKDRKSPFMQSEASDIYNGTGSLYFTIKHNGTTILCRLVIVKKDIDVLSISLRVGERKYSSPNANNIILSSLSIEGSDFFDVIFIDDNNSEILLANEWTPQSFVWSKSKGLLQYKYQTGETYSFYKKLTNKTEKK